ncbi:hypothetical protein G6F65_022146 [Rhizopus arrhizus]|nr:hypothetical protein G6F65_022146 [Rhizopus arrhizus]
MRRAADHEARALRHLAGGQIQPAFVDVGGQHADARGGQQRRKGPVAGAFHQRGVAGVGQQARAEVDGLVGAGRQDDLFRLADDRARNAQVVRDGLAQRHEARTVLGIAGQRQVGFAQVARQQPLPDMEREQLRPCRRP